MTMTDPIADMLTRVRNGNKAYHDTVRMPYSKIKTHIAEILQQEGYIAGWSSEGEGVERALLVDLKYGPEPRAHDRRHPPDLKAWPARLREGDQPAKGARRARCGDHQHVNRPAD